MLDLYVLGVSSTAQDEQGSFLRYYILYVWLNEYFFVLMIIIYFSIIIMYIFRYI